MIVFFYIVSKTVDSHIWQISIQIWIRTWMYDILGLSFYSWHNCFCIVKCTTFQAAWYRNFCDLILHNLIQVSWQSKVTIDCYGKIFCLVERDQFMKTKVTNCLTEGLESSIYQQMELLLRKQHLPVDETVAQTVQRAAFTSSWNCSPDS